MEHPYEGGQYDEVEDESPEMTYERMMDLQKKSKISLPILMTRLQLNPADVLNAYLMGSRLWGSASYNSDYDFMIVHKKWSSKASLHSGDIDATMYDQKEFIQKLKEHAFHEMICTWLPRSFVLKEELDPKQHFVLDPKKLRLSIFEETDRDWRMAQVTKVYP